MFTFILLPPSHHFSIFLVDFYLLINLMLKYILKCTLVSKFPAPILPGLVTSQPGSNLHTYPWVIVVYCVLIWTIKRVILRHFNFNELLSKTCSGVLHAPICHTLIWTWLEKYKLKFAQEQKITKKYILCLNSHKTCRKVRFFSKNNNYL